MNCTSNNRHQIVGVSLAAVSLIVCLLALGALQCYFSRCTVTSTNCFYTHLLHRFSCHSYGAFNQSIIKLREEH